MPENFRIPTDGLERMFGSFARLLLMTSFSNMAVPSVAECELLNIFHRALNNLLCVDKDVNSIDYSNKRNQYTMIIENSE